MRIGVVVDSCCDLPKEFIDAHGLIVMPITLRIGEKLIEDRRDPAETHAFYATQLDRKSEDFAESIPYSVQQIEQLFLERLVLDFDYVFCLTITAGRSAIYDHAMQASRADPHQIQGHPAPGGYSGTVRTGRALEIGRAHV